MKEKNQKNSFVLFFSFLIFVIIFLLVFSLKTFAQERPLEVEYPKIGDIKPETVSIGIVEYVKYIFSFIITISGIIALGALIWAGAHYLTSVGKPEELEKAKKQILAVLLGIGILLGSYLILYTIDPQLIILEVAPLIKLPLVKPELPQVEPARAITPLGKINEIAQNLKIASEGIKFYAQKIKDLIQECDCQNAQSVCLCKQYQGGSCQPLYCRIGPDSHPCPNWKEIKEAQQKIIAFKNEIIYYKNRIGAERNDLIFEIERLHQEITYYEEKIKIEKKVLAKIPADKEIAKEKQEKVIVILEEIKNNLESERNFKKIVIENFNSLFDLIIQLSSQAVKLAESPSSLINSCWQRVKEFCQGNCRGGCHDTEGCFPEKCTGGNPCLVNEINQIVEEVKKNTDAIIEICKDIYSFHEIIEKPLVLPAPPVPPPKPLPKDMCQNPQEMAKQNNVPYPRKNAPETEILLSCIRAKLRGENLGEISTYDKSHGICNYTRGNRICGPCSHSLYSCHYGGRTGSIGSLAIDYGNEKIGDKIIKTAKECGGIKSARCERKGGITVLCTDPRATHVHISLAGCDRN